MKEKHLEWLKQAEYDIGLAQYMYEGGHNFYAVFMCHLSIEKALKGLFYKSSGEIPPKTHNLVHLLKDIANKPDEEMLKFIIKINSASVVTRYPEDLNKIRSQYPKNVTDEIIQHSKEVIEWVKRQF